MTDNNNLFDLVRATNPVDEAEVEGPDSPRAQEQLTRILASPIQEPQRRRMPRRRLRVVITLAVLALATTAAGWLWTRVIERPNAVLCYERADLDADIAGAPAGDRATADACAPVWQDGVLVNPEVATPGSVPPLTACVTENGSLAVFPTDDPVVCDRLGLAHPEPAGQESADAVRQLEGSLISFFQSRECIPIAEAETETRRILDQSGFTGWKIQTQPGSPDRPCGSFSIDAPSETIHLIPIPEPTS
jgi:hypothetical protein